MMQAPTWIRTTWLTFDLSSLRFDLGLLYATWNPAVSVISAIVVLVGLALVVRRRWGVRAAAALLLLALAPVTVSVVLSLTVSPVFIARTLAAVTVPAMILTAAGLSWPGGRRFAALPVAGLLVLAYGYTGAELAALPPGQDWYGAIRWLAPRMGPGDVVWTYPNEGALPLHYALKDEGRDMTIVPIPAPVPAFGHGGFYITGSQGVVSMYPREIDALMRTPAARTPPTIWILRMGPWKYDPGDRMMRALGRTRTVVGHYREGAIDFTGFRRRSERAAPNF
jgi:mannosyltransferase